MLKNYQPSAFPSVIIFFNPLFNTLYLQCRRSYIGSNLSDAIFNLSRPKEETSCKAHVRLLWTFSSTERLPRSSRCVLKAQSQQSGHLPASAKKQYSIEQSVVHLKSKTHLESSSKVQISFVDPYHYYKEKIGELYLTAPVFLFKILYFKFIFGLPHLTPLQAFCSSSFSIY